METESREKDISYTHIIKRANETETDTSVKAEIIGAQTKQELAEEVGDGGAEEAAR